MNLKKTYDIISFKYCSKSKYYVVLYANRYEYFIFKAITNITTPVTNPDVTNEKILGTKINV